MDFDDLDQEEEVAKQEEDVKRKEDEEKRAAEKEKLAAARREASERIAAERAEAAAGAAAAAAPAVPNGTKANGVNGANGEAEDLALWEVIGGVDKGGIMVREGESTSSTQKTDRLSTGALVEELELKGDRLHYKLKKGTGPEEGWVSVKLTGKDLLVPWVEIGEFGPKRRPPKWKVVKQPQIEYAQMKEIASKNDPGDYYGMKFPYTKDMLVEMGPEWLTQAFHKSGVLPRDNAVTKITDAKEFVGGGAGLKCTFTVEYKKDEAYLHKKLFAKLPHKPGGSDRYFVSCMWNHDRPEIVFNIFLQDSVPFRVPKFYFGDISATTTNFILITETIDWAEGGKKVFSPGEIEPAYDKYKDWELPDGGPMYYMACCRALGKMAGYHKQKRLHKSIDEMFPMPDPIPAIPPLPSLDALTKKQNAAKIDQFLSWSSLNRLDVWGKQPDTVGETAKAVMPDEITDPAFLQQWKVEIQDVADAWINDNWSLDIEDQEMPGSSPKSSFLQRDEQNEVEVGLLDWGVLACGPLIGAMQGADSVAAAAFAATFQFAEHETRECSAACCGGAQTCSDVIALWGSSQELLAELARARGPLPVDQEFGVAAFWTVASGRAHSTRIKLQQLIEDYRRSCTSVAPVPSGTDTTVRPQRVQIRHLTATGHGPAAPPLRTDGPQDPYAHKADTFLIFRCSQGQVSLVTSTVLWCTPIDSSGLALLLSAIASSVLALRKEMLLSYEPAFMFLIHHGNVTQVLKFTKAAEWQEIKDWMDPRLLDRFQTRAHTTQFKEALQLYRKWDLYGVFHKWKRDNGLPKK
ncbi:unnamed protein product [Durusdinium trenchii]|uniref:SH3 domain-containing protein n=1 Tax=Durusdinium trenchii TaxID=1381693 RepID=A0ABP0RM92_9DINO